MEVVLAAPPNLVSFIVNEITLHNALQGDLFLAKIGGLLSDTNPNTTVEFARLVVGGDEWVNVYTDGSLSGAPGVLNRQTRVVVQVISSDGTTSLPTAVISVRSAGAVPVRKLTIMRYRLWHGGTQVSDYYKKQVRFLVESRADVVGLQESTGDHASRLASALAWYVCQGRDVGVISRYPIVSKLGKESHIGHVQIALDGEESQIIIWHAHLGYDPYGPSDLCFDKMTVEEVLEREDVSRRTPQVLTIMERMKHHLANSHNIPVLLGDLRLDRLTPRQKLRLSIYPVVNFYSTCQGRNE
jgi:hypothetical protein